MVEGERIIEPLLYIDQPILQKPKAFMQDHYQAEKSMKIEKPMTTSQNKEDRKYSSDNNDSSFKHLTVNEKIKYLVNLPSEVVIGFSIVHRKMVEKSGTIDTPIGRKPGSIIERTVTELGKKAITHYTVVKETEKYSVLHIELETGRTHQIRVHFSSINHPLVGDDLYGGKKDTINRQALHCTEINFTHPFTKEQIIICSKLPQDMMKMIENEKR